MCRILPRRGWKCLDLSKATGWDYLYSGAICSSALTSVVSAVFRKYQTLPGCKGTPPWKVPYRRLCQSWIVIYVYAQKHVIFNQKPINRLASLTGETTETQCGALNVWYWKKPGVSAGRLLLTNSRPTLASYNYHMHSALLKLAYPYMWPTYAGVQLAIECEITLSVLSTAMLALARPASSVN